MATIAGPEAGNLKKTPVKTALTTAMDDLAQLEKDLSFFDGEFQNIGSDSPGMIKRSFLTARAGPRFCNLGRFKEVSEQFASLGKELEGASYNSNNTPPENLESSTLPNSFESQTTLVQSLLKSYMHNLKEGTLLTEEKVDRHIAAILEKMLCIGAGLDVKAARLEELAAKELIANAESPTDEQRILLELANYQIKVVKEGKTLDCEVHALAGQILSWAAQSGLTEEEIA